MDLIDMEEDTIDAEVMDNLAVTMEDFRVSNRERAWTLDSDAINLLIWNSDIHADVCKMEHPC